MSDPPRPRVFARAERTAEEHAELLRERAELQRTRPSLDDLMATGDYEAPLPQGTFYELLQIMHLLKSVREQLGLSLGDLAERSGIDKAALSRLESGRNANPSLETMHRYATALGKRVRLTIVDGPPRKTP